MSYMVKKRRGRRTSLGAIATIDTAFRSVSPVTYSDPVKSTRTLTSPTYTAPEKSVTAAPAQETMQPLINTSGFLTTRPSLPTSMSPSSTMDVAVAPASTSTTPSTTRTRSNLTPAYTSQPLIPSYAVSPPGQPQVSVIPLQTIQPVLVPWLDNRSAYGAGGGGGVPREDEIPPGLEPTPTVIVQNKIPWWLILIAGGLYAKMKGII